jgi:hypothetical protein
VADRSAPEPPINPKVRNKVMIDWKGKARVAKVGPCAASSQGLAHSGCVGDTNALRNRRLRRRWPHGATMVRPDAGAGRTTTSPATARLTLVELSISQGEQPGILARRSQGDSKNRTDGVLTRPANQILSHGHQGGGDGDDQDIVGRARGGAG